MQFRGDGTQDGGSVPVTDGNWDIDHQSDLLLNVVAKMPKQGQEYVSTKTIAQVDYAVAVRDGEGNIPVIDEEKLTTYYTFTDDPSTGGWKVGLTNNFKGALTSNVNYEDWDAGTALPYLPSTYQGKPITSMRGMFANCLQLHSLDLSNFDTSNVIDMSYMFDSSQHIKTINFSGWRTTNVEDMQAMFSGCLLLQSLDLRDFDTKNVTNMSYMFSMCRVLTSLNVSTFNTRNVTNMEYMFQNCLVLPTLDLSSFDTSGLNSTTGMFFGCNTLSTCYGRTQADCNKFNGSRNKSSNVNFIVKPEA